MTLASRIFAILNWIAFFGWSFVGHRLLLLLQSSNGTGKGIHDLQTPVLALEGICVIELIRIFVGDLKGNFVLGVILHAIRLLTILETMTRIPNHWTGISTLGSWAITEIFRYPMYIFPSNKFCRSVRMVIPLVTFPIGAFSEAYGAYTVFFDPESPPVLQIALSVVLLVNGVLGPTMAYPALVKKGLSVIQSDDKQKEKEKKMK